MKDKYSNYHTHTTFCDGKDTPEDMIIHAISLGCPEIGFSGHSYTYFDESWCMSKEETEGYFKCISALKEKYSDKIKVRLGIEQDLWSEEPTDRYDYVVGGVHYVKKEDSFLPTDESAELTKKIVAEHYRGDYISFCEDYFRDASLLYERTKCDIIAHFDIITKFNEGDILFDTSCERYRKAYLSALDILCKTPVKFEINTGAISRGYRTAPYPAPDIITEIKKRGSELILSSDAHAMEGLLFGFDKYACLL